MFCVLRSEMGTVCDLLTSYEKARKYSWQLSGLPIAWDRDATAVRCCESRLFPSGPGRKLQKDRTITGW